MTLGVWHFFGTQVDGSGFVKVLPNATVTVRRESDGGLAELEADIDGGSPGLDNPFTAGSDGEIAFYADPSERYRIDIESGALTLTLRHQSVSTPPITSFVQTLIAAADAQESRQTLHAPLRGHLSGLTLSNNGTDATNDIDIAVGECADDAGEALLRLSVSLTKRLDAAWAVGTGNGGLDTGSIANDVYHVWLIRRSDTGVVDALFSASATAPTMPANYDQKRRIGSIIRSGGAVLAFTQFGDRFQLDDSVLDANNQSLGTTPANYTLTVPDGIRVLARIRFMCANASAYTRFLVYSPYQTDEVAGAQNGGAFNPASGIRGATEFEIMTDTSAQIRAVAESASSSIDIRTLGWTDWRGRFD